MQSNQGVSNELVTKTMVIYNMSGGDQIVEDVTTRDPKQAACRAPNGARTFLFADQSCLRITVGDTSRLQPIGGQINHSDLYVVH